MITARLVLLDIGATLVTGPAKTPAARISARLALPAHAKAVLRAALMTTAFCEPAEVAVLVRGLTRAPEEEIDAVVADVWAAQQTDARPLDGAVEALAHLSKLGLRLGIVSNIWSPYLDSVRSHFGSFFDEHIPEELQLFSFREGCAKPSVAIFQKALRAAAVEPCETIMIGDSYHEDIEPAAGLGMKTVWVLHRPQREVADQNRVLKGQAPAPSRTISSIVELTGLVAGPS
jgi:HAD superfamily hydrolase (TIGR01509 family)